MNDRAGWVNEVTCRLAHQDRRTKRKHRSHGVQIWCTGSGITSIYLGRDWNLHSTSICTSYHLRVQCEKTQNGKRNAACMGRLWGPGSDHRRSRSPIRFMIRYLLPFRCSSPKPASDQVLSVSCIISRRRSARM
jgi:hypothetical protein